MSDAASRSANPGALEEAEEEEADLAANEPMPACSELRTPGAPLAPPPRDDGSSQRTFDRPVRTVQKDWLAAALEAGWSPSCHNGAEGGDRRFFAPATPMAVETAEEATGIIAEGGGAGNAQAAGAMSGESVSSAVHDAAPADAIRARQISQRRASFVRNSHATAPPKSSPHEGEVLARVPFASLSSPSDEAFASDDGVSEYALSPDVVTPSPAVAGSQAAAYASQPFGNAHPLARDFSVRRPVVWDDGAAWDSSREESTPKIMARMPKRGPGGGVEKDAASGKGDGEAKRTSAADAPAAAAKAHPQPSAPVSRRGIGLMARASSRPPPNAAASAPPPAAAKRKPSTSTASGTNQSTAAAAQINAAKARRSVARRSVVDATPPVGGSKVDARFAMTPKVIARAQSIKEKTLVPPTPVTDDAAEGDDERRRVRWIAHYLKHGRVQDALDLGWDGLGWMPGEQTRGVAKEAEHPVHGLVYQL